MATNGYLVFAGGNAPTTQGESTYSGHLNSIELMSFNWGAQNAVNLSHTPANPTPLVLTLTKGIDAASVPLYQTMLNSKYYGTATLYVVKPGSPPLEYLIYTFSTVGVSSIQHFFSGDTPTEQVTLVFTSAQVSYAKTNNSGSLGTPVVYGWNFATNSPQ